MICKWSMRDDGTDRRSLPLTGLTGVGFNGKMTIRLLLTSALAIATAVGPAAQGVRPGYYTVGSFSGSSMGDDAAIWNARIQGIGAVYVGGGNPALELVVRQRASDAAPVVAYLGTVERADGLHSVYAANEPNLVGELERVSHEEYGLVVDLVQSGWARTVYGYTRTGQVRRGWVRLVPGGVEYKSYDAQIVQHLTWFEKPESVELFDRPNGRRLRFPLRPSAADAAEDYELEVLSIRGSWIQVQLTVPNTNACAGNPEAKVERRTRAWVHRHDRRGRYQIAYAAAGC
jgi:hypothetical protein